VTACRHYWRRTSTRPRKFWPSKFGKKLKTETASFDAYHFRNLSNIHVDSARVHRGMDGWVVKHSCMPVVVHMNRYRCMNLCICTSRQKNGWIHARSESSEYA
jgi:hypothetical protein